MYLNLKLDYFEEKFILNYLLPSGSLTVMIDLTVEIPRKMRNTQIVPIFSLFALVQHKEMIHVLHTQQTSSV